MYLDFTPEARYASRRLSPIQTLEEDCSRCHAAAAKCQTQFDATWEHMKLLVMDASMH